MQSQFLPDPSDRLTISSIYDEVSNLQTPLLNVLKSACEIDLGLDITMRRGNSFNLYLALVQGAPSTEFLRS